MPVPGKYLETYQRLLRAAEQLHRKMENGEFYSLGYIHRRKLIRRVKKYYNRLAGPMAPVALWGAVAATGVLALAGCRPPAESQIPSFLAPVAATQIDYSPYHAPIVAPTLVDIEGDLDVDGDLDIFVPQAYIELYWDNRGYGWYTTSFQDNTGSATDFTLGGYVENPGNPNALNPASFDGTTHIYSTALDFAKLDADGDFDAVTAGRLYTNVYPYDGKYGIFWVENTGTPSTPSFSDPVLLLDRGDYNYGNRHMSRIQSLTLADFDADGDYDMLFVQNNEVYLSINNGDADPAAAFSTPITSDFIGGLLPYDYIHSVEAVDLDSDGDIDLLLGVNYYYYDYDTYEATSEAKIIFYENLGIPEAPDFATGLVNGMGIQIPDTVDWNYTFQRFRAGLGIAAGDMDGDGDVDLILGPYTDYLVYPDTFVAQFFYLENVAANAVE